MSDTDDGFDEEAVRRELREKYENDDRGETERMSELLLQGATMTNQHCDACGSPIFRYDGQSFCPNCQHAARQAQQDEQPSQSPQAQQDEQGGQHQEDAGSANGGQHAADAGAAANADAGFAADVDASAVEGATGDDGRAQSAPQSRGPDRTPAPASAGGREHGEAADALEAAVAALARRAAGSDDPRRAREHLEAAREAAEALAALRHNT
ncbi:Sjogren's syndrome/scleroderma autoantigen 1 family protein [Halobacterium yunchengense]|uniref:Sjogren's syndrome/scleroderma autoantigen 1 family protein n=1 Tax=Halobacterium yunchengense TaxID=3108497 RepID=UPI00300830F2